MTAATRRDAIRRAALAAGAVATPALLRPGTARAQVAEDDEGALEDFLVEAIAIEQIAELAYTTAANELDEAGLTQTLERFASQERAHATALRSALDSLGVDPPDPPSGPRDTQVIEGVGQLDADRVTELTDLLGGLAGLEERDEYLEHLLVVEDEQIALYLAETPEFASEDLLRTGAEIAACEAQHVVVLREALGSPPARAVPDLPRPSPAGE